MSYKRNQNRARRILDLLEEAYPDAGCALRHVDPYQLLVSVMLSAQSTDARVNLITPALFSRYPGPAQLAEAGLEEVEDLVRTCGLYRNKAKNLIGAAKGLMALHDGSVPRERAALMRLPGIGRKSANVILSVAFGKDAIAVDTHVGRLSRRLSFSCEENPDHVERDLRALLPRQRWSRAHHLLIRHGREICHARNPKCGSCVICSLCPASATSPGT